MRKSHQMVSESTNLWRICPWKALIRPTFEMPLDPPSRLLRKPSVDGALDQVRRFLCRTPAKGVPDLPPMVLKQTPAKEPTGSRGEVLEVAWHAFETKPLSSNISGQVLAYLWKWSSQFCTILWFEDEPFNHRSSYRQDFYNRMSSRLVFAITSNVLCLF